MRTLKNVSHADNYPQRYLVAADTPDGGRSTWPECFGRNAKSGRVFFGSDHLGKAVGMMDKHSFIIDRQTGREVGQKRIKAADAVEA